MLGERVRYLPIPNWLYWRCIESNNGAYWWTCCCTFNRHSSKVADNTDHWLFGWYWADFFCTVGHGRSGQLKVTRFHSQHYQGQDPSQTQSIKCFRERERERDTYKMFWTLSPDIPEALNSLCCSSEEIAVQKNRSSWKICFFWTAPSKLRIHAEQIHKH